MVLQYTDVRDAIALYVFEYEDIAAKDGDIF